MQIDNHQKRNLDYNIQQQCNAMITNMNVTQNKICKQTNQSPAPDFVCSKELKKDIIMFIR